MDVLRTPDERFVGLVDWPYEPCYRTVVDSDGTELRIHFVDEGPREHPPILLMHGNPSWSYLHRHMIAGLVALGHRVVAVDLVGMGRSDKPAIQQDYTLARHLDWMGQWLVAEDLQNATLYCQDWGGIIGLCMLQHHGDRFARVIASNTGLPVGGGVSKFMQAWLDHSQSVESLDISGLVDGITTRSLSAAERAAYDAPFPDGSFQSGPMQFPLLIPLQPDNPGLPIALDAWEYLAGWTKPFLTVFGSADPVATRPKAHLRFQEIIPGAQRLDHVMIEGANHFIQEDAPQELVRIIDEYTRY